MPIDLRDLPKLPKGFDNYLALADHGRLKSIDKGNKRRRLIIPKVFKETV